MCYVIAMKVTWNGNIYEFERAMTVSRLLDHFSLNRETHLVVSNGKLVTEDLKVEKNDEIKIIRVISGG